MKTLIRFLQTLAVCALVEVLGLLAVARFVPGDAGFLTTCVLFFAVDPLFAAAYGVYAGRAPRERWFVPLTVGAMYVLGTWFAFSFGETAFFIYGAAYLLIGLVAMLISAFFAKRRAAQDRSDPE